MADIIINSTRTLQMVATLNGVTTTMDTCQFTLLNPNLVPVVGPLAATSVSTGVYQYAIPIGMLTIPGNWMQTWYIQKGASSLQQSSVFSVGLL